MVEIIRTSFALVEPRAEELGRFFYATLFSQAPETRALFPVNMEVQRSRLLRALVHVVQMVDQPDDLVPFLEQLGRDHRKFGVFAEHYDASATRCCTRSARSPGRRGPRRWRRPGPTPTPSSPAPCAPRPTAEHGPASWLGRVCEHRRIGWDLALITVQTSEPIPYRAGQYISVETPQRPRLWRYLSPANAPRTDGTLDFHVRAVEQRLGEPGHRGPLQGGRHLADRPADGPHAHRPALRARRADGGRRHRDGADQGAARGPGRGARGSRTPRCSSAGAPGRTSTTSRAAQVLLPQPLAGRHPGGGEGRDRLRAPSAARWPTWSPATAPGPTTTCWSAGRRR